MSAASEPTPRWRPAWHFTPRRNWINDPNGLVWFDGEWHLFYQHNPFGDQWGHMSWGHAVSTDLLHWHELPVAIPEDEWASIFSGSVVVDTHNSSGFGDGSAPPLVAVYTGCLRRPEGGQAQELALSTDRGRTWTKYPGNPVLDIGVRDFRDPKVFWHAPTQRWVMVVVLPDDRAARFYASADLKRWALLSTFDAPFDGQGIWECPDLLQLPVAGEATPRWLFKVDVFGGHPSGGTGARVFTGHFDGTRFVADPEIAPTWADGGSDFYAALSWAHAPDGRALWLAWMNCHRYAKHLPTSPWRGSMTVPRELALRRQGSGLQLLQQPAPELLALRGQGVELAPAAHAGEVPLPLRTGWSGDVVLALQGTGAARCGLRLRSGPAEWVDIGWDAQAGAVYVDRTHSGFVPPGDPHYAGRRLAVLPAAPSRLRVLLDAGSVEVFVGDGEATLTEQVLPLQGDGWRLSLFSEGGATRWGAVQAWPLRAAMPG